VFGLCEKITNCEKPMVMKFQRLWPESGSTCKILPPTGKISTNFVGIWHNAARFRRNWLDLLEFGYYYQIPTTKLESVSQCHRISVPKSQNLETFGANLGR
jgi:hypothetical protein